MNQPFFLEQVHSLADRLNLIESSFESFLKLGMTHDSLMDFDK